MSRLIHAPTTTANLTATMETAAPHLRPVLQAVRDCGVGFLFATQGSGPFAIPAKPRRAAAIVILGDDMEQSMGPDGFHLPSVRRVIRSCAGFAVVSSTPDVSIYAGLSAVAVGGKNALLIETRIEHEFQWVELIQKLAPKRPLILATVQGGRA